MKGTIESLRFTDDNKRVRTVVRENATEVDFRAYTAMYKEENNLGKYIGTSPYLSHFDEGMLEYKLFKVCVNCDGDCEECQL